MESFVVNHDTSPPFFTHKQFDFMADGVPLIEVENEDALFRVFQEYDAIVALFYASWCPFCRAFLPTFTRTVGNRQLASLCVKINDIMNPLWEIYEIEVVPTVLYFERGKLVQRLNGKLGVGLSETRLVDVLMRN